MDVFLAYARRGRNAWWLYLLIAAAAVGGFGWLIVNSPPNATAEQLLDPKHPVLFFVITAASFGVILFVFSLVVLLVQAKWPWDLAGKWSWKAFLAGIGVWIVGTAVTAMADFLVDPGSIHFTASNATTVLALAALLALPVQTFTEEIIFRGWVTQGLMLATKRPWVTSVIAGLLFGSLHIPNGTPQAIAAVIFGVATSRMAIQLGGLAFAFGVHLVNNLFGSVVVVSNTDVFKGSAGIFTENAPGLEWYDVAVEAGLLAILVALVLGPLGSRLAPHLSPEQRGA